MAKLKEAGSLVDRLVVVIRDAVIEGEYAPGEPIRIKQLAERHGVSMIPVREALARLLATHIIVAEANRGYFVAPAPSEDEFAQFVQFRELFEVSAVALGFDNLSDREIDKLVHLNEKMRKIAQQSNRRRLLVAWGQHNAAFHGILVGLARNSFINEQNKELSFLHIHYQMARIKNLDLDILHTLVQEHDDLIEALKARDKDSFLPRLSTHINRART